MPTYRINGKTVRSENPLSDDEIDEIADGLRGDTSPQQNAPQSAQPPSPKPGVIQGFTEHFAPTAAFAHPGKLAEDVGNYFSGLEPKDLLRIGAPIEELIHAGQEIATPIAQAGIEAVERGDSLEAVARGLQFGLSLTPLAGGVVAGEKLADPSTRGEGFGAAAGELANVALPFLGKAPTALKAGGNRIASLGDSLVESAPRIYSEGLHPKLKFEGLAEQVGREGVSRGLHGSLDNLEQAAARIRSQSGPEIRRLIGESEAQIPIRRAAEGPLEKFGSSETLGGHAQGARDLATAAREEIMRLPEELSPLEAWDLISVKRDPAVRRGAFLPGADPQLGAALEAQTIAGEATSGALKEAIPDVAAPMKEYSFASKLQELLDNRKLTPESSLNPFKADSTFKLIDPYRMAQSVRRSTRYKTGSAVLRDRVGKLLQKARFKEAAKLVDLPPESFSLPPDQAPDMEVFASPSSPEVPSSSRAPQIFGGEVPPGFEMPEAQAQKLLGEFEASGFTPDDLSLEGLSDRQLERLAAADRKASEIALRTISNPTYQRLPVQAGTTGAKTKADVLRNIWERYRGNLGTGGGDGS